MMHDLSTTSARGELAGAEEQDRLARILDEYLLSLERGEAVAPADLLDRHPADADRLREYLSGLALFHNAVAGPKPPLLPDNGEQGPALNTLGDFRLLSEIGRGGMGIVYEAAQVSLGRRVAVKVLPLSSSVNEKQIARFRNEAQAAAQIDHHNIVPVFAIGEDNGINYYAM